MSFNKKYLPELPELIKVRETYSSDEEFLDLYFRKVDAILGSQESFDLSPESIREYREFMMDTFSLIQRNKAYFLRETKFPTHFKLERIDELLDFFVVEEDFEKCSELSSIKELLEIKLIINEH